jgi:predicted nuclease of predicted toxin-antitoxin system
MKFLLDMNLSPRLASVFRESGYESVHWIEVGSSTACDKDIMRWASENGWIIITNDLDFGAILALDGLRSPSVIQIRRLGLFPEAVFPILDRVVQQFADELESGAIIVIDEKRMRVRLLPLT